MNGHKKHLSACGNQQVKDGNNNHVLFCSLYRKPREQFVLECGKWQPRGSATKAAKFPRWQTEEPPFPAELCFGLLTMENGSANFSLFSHFMLL